MGGDIAPPLHPVNSESLLHQYAAVQNSLKSQSTHVMIFTYPPSRFGGWVEGARWRPLCFLNSTVASIKVVLMNAAVYVDAFNFYYGCLKNTPYRWLNLEAFCHYPFPTDSIVQIKYFTALVSAD